MIEMRKHLYASESLSTGCRISAMQFMIFEWFSWFPIILLLIFNLWLTFQEIRIEMRKKHLYASESLFKGCNVFPANAILWFWVVLVDSLSFLLLIFNLWLTFQEIWSKWGKSNKTLICFWITFQRPGRISAMQFYGFLSGLDDSPSFLLLIFNLWLTFQKIWSKWGKSNKNTYMLLNHFSKVVMYFQMQFYDFWVV